MKAKNAETGAFAAGEMSGHIFLLNRWYGFDDGLTPQRVYWRFSV